MNNKILNGNGITILMGLVKGDLSKKADLNIVKQSDWAQSMTESIDYIKNKPDL